LADLDLDCGGDLFASGDPDRRLAGDFDLLLAVGLLAERERDFCAERERDFFADRDRDFFAERERDFFAERDRDFFAGDFFAERERDFFAERERDFFTERERAFFAERERRRDLERDRLGLGEDRLGGDLLAERERDVFGDLLRGDGFLLLGDDRDRFREGDFRRSRDLDLEPPRPIVAPTLHNGAY